METLTQLSEFAKQVYKATAWWVGWEWLLCSHLVELLITLTFLNSYCILHYWRKNHIPLYKLSNALNNLGSLAYILYLTHILCFSDETKFHIYTVGWEGDVHLTLELTGYPCTSLLSLFWLIYRDHVCTSLLSFYFASLLLGFGNYPFSFSLFL